MAQTNFIEAVSEVVSQWAQDYGDKMRASLLKHGHTDSAGGGNLYQAAGVDPNEVVSQEGQFNFRVKITLPDYYKYLNKGRGPTKNPGDGALRRSLQGPAGWLSKKAIPVKQIAGLKSSIESNKAVAFIFARAIHKRGFKASYWFDEVWGGDPVPDNSPAVKDLENRLEKLFGDERFIVALIDPSTP